MSGGRTGAVLRYTALAGAMLLGAQAAHANDNPGTAMTAGVIMEKMPEDSRYYFISGIIEGLAYARFLKDTNAAGSNAQSGMNCIYDWFYADAPNQMLSIEAAFSKYKDHFPSVVLTAMIKRKCGE